MPPSCLIQTCDVPWANTLTPPQQTLWCLSLCRFWPKVCAHACLIVTHNVYKLRSPRLKPRICVDLPFNPNLYTSAFCQFGKYVALPHLLNSSVTDRNGFTLHHNKPLCIFALPSRIYLVVGCKSWAWEWLYSVKGQVCVKTIWSEVSIQVRTKTLRFRWCWY